MLQLVLFLKSVPLFQALSFDAIGRAAEAVETVSLQPDEHLCQAGDRITCLDVLSSGTIEVRFEGRVVETIGRGGLLGDGILIGEDHYVVAAQATAECTVLRFAASIVTDLASEEPRMLQSALRHLNGSRCELYRKLAAAQLTQLSPPPPTSRVLELVHSAPPTADRTRTIGALLRAGE